MTAAGDATGQEEWERRTSRLAAFLY